MTVRVDGAAGVLVGVDQRRERDRRLEAFVQAEAQFGQEGQVRAQAGQHDHLVHRLQTPPVVPDHDQPVVAVSLDRVGAEPGDGVRVALVDGGLRGQAEGAAGGELVGGAAAEGRAGHAAAQHPHRVCAGCCRRPWPGRRARPGR